METSKAYFEDILRRFDSERRGRTLFQFCRDEGVDYKSLMAYKRTPGTKTKGNMKKTEADTEMDESVELVELTVVDDIASPAPPSPARWEVVTLSVRTPEGDVIHLNCDSAAAVARLLSKLIEPLAGAVQSTLKIE